MIGRPVAEPRTGLSGLGSPSAPSSRSRRAAAARLDGFLVEGIYERFGNKGSSVCRCGNQSGPMGV
jgi:hypothetical protein